MQKCTLEKKKGFGTKPFPVPKNAKVHKCKRKGFGTKPCPVPKNANGRSKENLKVKDDLVRKLTDGVKKRECQRKSMIKGSPSINA